MVFIEYNKKLKITPEKDTVLSFLGCKKEDIIYESVSKQFDTLFQPALDSLDISYTASIEKNNIYVTITAGSAVSNISERYFKEGEAMAALMVNAIADEAVFMADSAVSERIKLFCANHEKGIKKRVEAPSSAPVSFQADVLKKAPLDGVSLTDAYMLSPVKTMCYMLELTDDISVFKAQHDCSKCSNMSCPRRVRDTGKSFRVLSGSGYIPSTATGLCIDIGTTTIAAVLYENGQKKAEIGETNAQRRFGADVLSRIEAYNSGRKSEIHSVLKYQLLRIINELNARNKPVIAAGNTAMTSFLMGYSCDKLGTYPFEAENLRSVTTQDGIHLVGGISPFIGGDISAGLYMLGFHENDDINMLVDIGTNGEMAIGNRDGIICTSTAAGPAFEGGGISCGVGSIDGAVCSIDLKSNMIKTINDKKAVGICGTGIVELCAELIKNRYMDETGKLNEKLNGKFTVSDNIYFTQKDIRAFQTAKSAIRTGIEILIAESGIDPDNISNIYIAGGFGQNLDIKKACAAGLLPSSLIDKYIAVGNTSLGGCVKLLENDNGFYDIDKLRELSRVFSLAEHKDFTDLFLKYMYFKDDII